MTDAPSIISVNPTHFFREKVLAAQQRQNVKLTENVEYYIVNLLCDMMTTNAQGGADDCLALILKEALESAPAQQIVLFKRLGDTSLYFSGFFQEYFTKKCFDLSYYTAMGQSAYGQLSSLVKRKTDANMASIYSDLSKSFPLAVDILVDVSAHSNISPKPRDTLSVYDAWLSSSSKFLEQELKNRGIRPIKMNKSNLQ